MPPLTAANQLIRARNVTASEVGALLGEHPYCSPGSIFDRIMAGSGTGLRAQSDAMRIGGMLEPVIRDLAADRLGVPVMMNSKTYEYRDNHYKKGRVRLCATPDAFVAPRSWHGHALVEFKASGSRWRWEHGLPADVEWQCRAQLACTKRDRVFVFVLVGVTLYDYVVERKLGPERRMTRAVEAFWRDHIETGIRPAEPVQALEVKITDTRHAKANQERALQQAMEM